VVAEKEVVAVVAVAVAASKLEVFTKATGKEVVAEVEVVAAGVFKAVPLFTHRKLMVQLGV